MKAVYCHPRARHFHFGMPSRRSWFANAVANATTADTAALNIAETAQSFELELALPGFEKSEISVSYNKDVLSIEAQKSTNTDTPEGEQKTYRRREFNFTHFKRNIEVAPNLIDQQAIAARYENGVLYLSLPKLKATEPHDTAKTISVN